MGFVVLLIFAALSLASCAAFFSIYGLAQIFSGSFYPIIAMGVALEIGKLVGASFVYRYWRKLPKFWPGMRVYVTVAVVALMIFTSTGIFGFLSAAYQKDVLPLQQKQQQIILLQQEKQQNIVFKTERLERRKQIDADIASLPNNYITGRQRLMRSYGPELDQIRSDIADYTKRIKEITLEMHKLKSERLQEEVHVGPIVFIAQAFDVSTNNATKWLIFLIIFAFDPLAVVLTVGANIVILDRRNQIPYIEPDPRIVEREIVEREIVNKETHSEPTDVTQFFEKALQELEKKIAPTEEDKALKAAIAQILRRNQISQDLRIGKT